MAAEEDPLRSTMGRMKFLDALRDLHAELSAGALAGTGSRPNDATNARTARLEHGAKWLARLRGDLILGCSPDVDELTSAMIGVGLLFTGHANYGADIERTLVFASSDGMDRNDYRTLSVLTTWLEIHHACVNADRLLLLVRQLPSARVRIYWAAVGQWLASKDGRIAQLRALKSATTREPIYGTREETDFLVTRHGGEDLRFAGGPLRVPGRLLRNRMADVSEAPWLVRWHVGYRWRLLLGGTYLADALAALDEGRLSAPA